MKRRFYLVLVVLALILLALPGFAARAGKRAVGLAPRFAEFRRVPRPASAGAHADPDSPHLVSAVTQL